MSKMRILRTANDVVAAFGGTKAAAEWAGVGESAVSNWIARGFIPPGWHFRMHEHFEARQYRLESTVFGHVVDEPNPKRRTAPIYSMR